MSNTYNLSNNTKTSNSWIYSILLFVSFLWVALYPATSILVESFEFGYGNLLNFSGENSSYIVMMILSEALYMFIGFELIFYFYRYFLTFKIYSFIVPTDNLKVESRVFFIYRNLVFGLVSNLCFLFPFLYKFLPFFDLVTTMIFLLIYACHLNKKYAEPIIGHFVFKNFCYPVFFYEALVVLFQVLEVL